MEKMAASLEEILVRLLVPDNSVLLQATNDLRKTFKDPSINIALCQCLTSSPNVQVRQYAAVLLRRKLTKGKHWKRVPQDIKHGLKQNVIEALLKEPEKPVRTAIAQLISTLAKHELSSGSWPELLQMLNQYIQSSNTTDKEIGLFTMSTLTSSAALQLKPHLKSLLSLFAKSLQDTSSKWIPFYTILSLTNLVSCIGTEEMNQFQALIPSVMVVIRNLASDDEDQACEAMEIFDELVESEVAIVVPHIKPLIGMCLEIAGSQNLGDNLRVKAISIISWLTRLKKKTILKHKLVPPIINVLFPIMCHPSSGDEDDDDDDEDSENQSPSSIAAQLIDVMALHLPPEKLIPPLMHHMEPALASNNPHHKKAAYLALAVIAEGCSEYIRSKYLQTYLQVICKGITENHPIVRNAALFSLGQFAEFLQPEISKFASDLLPVLFEYLSQTCQQLQQGEKDPPSLTKTFYALETFCENLEGNLLPYLPALMERLLTFLTSTKSVNAKELAISAIGAVANAAKESIIPYFPCIIEHLKIYLSEQQSEPNMPLQVQAIDTLGVLARTVGDNNFLPMAHDCMRLGLELVDKAQDPDLRRCTYGLFASVSTVLKTDMAQYLPTIIDHILHSIQSAEGVVPHYAQEENAGFTLFEDVEEDEIAQNEDEIIDDQDDEDEDEDITGYSVENAYLEEKEDACCALREISSNVGLAFIPYLEKCFDEVKKLIEHPGMEVRRAAICTLGQFCITLNQVFHETGSLEHRAALEKALCSFLPKLFATSREDTERQVVLSCLETLNEMLENIKEPVLNGSSVDSVIMLIKDVLKHKLACQDEDEEDDADAQQAEYDGMLMEFAGDIIPTLAKIVPSQQFAPYFAGVLPMILAKTKKSCPVSDKSFTIGTLADVIESMDKGSSRPFLPHLLPVFLGGMKDDDDEVRSNAVYGLGVLVQNVTDAIFPQYPSLLQSLSTMLAQEDNPRAKDNLCATVARMIMTNVNGVPLKQVFPAFLQCLPLQEDLEENITVYRCLAHLYKIRCVEFFQNLPEILKILSVVLYSKKLNDDTGALIIQLVKAVHREFPSDFETVLKTLPTESSETLKAAIVHS